MARVQLQLHQSLEIYSVVSVRARDLDDAGHSDDAGYDTGCRLLVTRTRILCGMFGRRATSRWDVQPCPNNYPQPKLVLIQR